jgi:GH25 family lysozyme M1 (1,4-beta-N-acetylmuramidase)
MRTVKATGIDVSKWQGTINWDKLEAAYRAGTIGYIIMRAGYGYATVDPLFEAYYAEATKRGIPVGAYWYAYWAAGTPQQEAQAAIAICSGKVLQYGIWLDVEYERSITSLDKHTRTDNTLAALAVLEASGRYTGLYASTDMINNRMEYARLDKYDIWAAQYGSLCTCKIPCGMWQYTSGGSADGIAGRVDMDRAYKDYPDIVTGTLASGTAPAQQLPTGGEDMPPRTTATRRIGPMTRGDLTRLLAETDKLGLYIVGTLDVGPMTDGDDATIKALAVSLGLNNEEV